MFGLIVVSPTGCYLKVFDKNIFLKFPYFNGIHRFLPALFKGYKLKTKFINVNHKNIRSICDSFGSDVILGLKKKNSILLGNGKLKRSNVKIKLYTLIIKPNFGCSTKSI